MTGYLDEALTDLDGVIRRAVQHLRGEDFDTLVGTGLSGALVVPTLAREMGKEFVIVRKEFDDSHHGGEVVGVLGHRWVFVDDFVSSGDTRRRVIDTMGRLGKDFATYVGDYTYSTRRRGPGFSPVSDESDMSKTERMLKELNQFYVDSSEPVTLSMDLLDAFASKYGTITGRLK